MSASSFATTLTVDRELSEQRVFAWMLSLLAVLGFALAALGLYGLIAQSTIERRPEFGIRLALRAGVVNEQIAVEQNLEQLRPGSLPSADTAR